MEYKENNLLELTVEIVSAFVGRNSIPQSELPALIASIYSSLGGLGASEVVAPSAPQIPAVSIKRSITPEYLICLEDGKRFKTLKRHITSKYGLTPDQYRAKWNLPPDYPMVAPAYAERRSALALSSGLGRKTGTKITKGKARKAS